MPGQIRLLMPEGRRYLKHYDADGTIAFRMDSVLSHVSSMHGAFPESPYGLKPGQLLPAQYTDENVKGGVYFYGSLTACLQSGQGKWKLRPQDIIDEQTQAFCDLCVFQFFA
jgi:hypothetical protein